jgi:trigger factor
VLSAVIDDSEFSSYPENLMKEFDRIIESNSKQYGIEKDVYLMYFYGVTTDEQYDSLKKHQVGIECVTAAVIQAEKITVSDEEVNSLAQNYVKEYGFESLDALYKAIPKTSIENMLLSDKATEFMTKNAVIKVIDEAATDK